MGPEMDAARIIKNPPLAAYYIALVAALTGWSEIPLHLAFLLPAITAVLGTYFLAREFTQHPVAATLIGILNPVFILSGITVMCDVMMLAFYVWAIFFWVRGIKDNRDRNLFIAAVLTTLCCLTKYFGLSLISTPVPSHTNGRWKKGATRSLSPDPDCHLSIYQLVPTPSTAGDFYQMQPVMQQRKGS